MKITIGTDILKMNRVKKSLQEDHEGFLALICTPNEIKRLNQIKYQSRLIERVSGIFALKEAFAKSLGTGFDESLSFQDIETYHLPSGQPVLAYIGSVYDSQNWSITCSLSHDAGIIFATVLLSRPE